MWWKYELHVVLKGLILSHKTGFVLIERSRGGANIPTTVASMTDEDPDGESESPLPKAILGLPGSRLVGIQSDRRSTFLRYYREAFIRRASCLGNFAGIFSAMVSP